MRLIIAASLALLLAAPAVAAESGFKGAAVMMMVIEQRCPDIEFTEQEFDTIFSIAAIELDRSLVDTTMLVAVEAQLMMERIDRSIGMKAYCDYAGAGLEKAWPRFRR